jgi:hypothetical protein
MKIVSLMIVRRRILESEGDCDAGSPFIEAVHRAQCNSPSANRRLNFAQIFAFAPRLPDGQVVGESQARLRLQEARLKVSRVLDRDVI